MEGWMDERIEGRIKGRNNSVVPFRAIPLSPAVWGMMGDQAGTGRCPVAKVG